MWQSPWVAVAATTTTPTTRMKGRLMITVLIVAAIVEIFFFCVAFQATSRSADAASPNVADFLYPPGPMLELERTTRKIPL